MRAVLLAGLLAIVAAAGARATSPVVPLAAGIYGYDERGRTITPGFGDEIDALGARAARESGAAVYVYVAEGRRDPREVAADVARSWRLTAEPVLIVLSDGLQGDAALAVRPSTRLDPAQAARVRAVAARPLTTGARAQALVAAARLAVALVRPPAVAHAAAARAHERESLAVAILELLLALVASGVAWARDGQRLRLASPGAAGLLADGRLEEHHLDAARLAGATDEPAELAARLRREAAALRGGRLASGLAAAAAGLGIVGGALTGLRFGAGRPAAIMLAGGLVASAVLATSARVSRRDDAGLAFRIRREELREGAASATPAERATVYPLAVALGVGDLYGERDG